jgi:hypothetical protein
MSCCHWQGRLPVLAGLFPYQHSLPTVTSPQAPTTPVHSEFSRKEKKGTESREGGSLWEQVMLMKPASVLPAAPSDCHDRRDTGKLFAYHELSEPKSIERESANTTQIPRRQVAIYKLIRLYTYPLHHVPVVDESAAPVAFSESIVICLS